MTANVTPADNVTPAAAMDAALDAAGRGVRGANPLVGAVLTDPAGTVLSVGWHEGAGTDHAEVDALRRARDAGLSAEGCTMFVTLEPCNHRGRTGPCTKAIVAAGIAKVHYATPEPQEYAGGGARWLAENGVVTECGLRRDAARKLNDRWFLSRSEGRPFVTLKTAQTLDGFSAAADGTSQWITGPAARGDGHRLRRLADAVLVGTGTVLADDPKLTARDNNGARPHRQPLRVVAGLRDLPREAQVHGGAGESLHLRERDPRRILAALQQRGIGHVLLEGGPTLAAAFMDAGLVDEVFAYVAPSFLGEGKPSFPAFGAESIGDLRRWDWDSTLGGPAMQLSGDLRLHLQPFSKGSS